MMPCAGYMQKKKKPSVTNMINTNATYIKPSLLKVRQDEDIRKDYF